MNLVHSEGREPQLGVDDSVCNTNALCHVPESYSNPALASARAAFPLRGRPPLLGALEVTSRPLTKVYVAVNLIRVFWAYRPEVSISLQALPLSSHLFGNVVRTSGCLGICLGWRKLQLEACVDRRDLHKVTGMIQGLLQAFPMAHVWTGAFYRDLRCPPATLHSLDPAYFADLHSGLDDGMLFVKVPSETAITVGSTLLEVRRVPMTPRQDLHNLVLPGKRVCLRVADPAAPTRARSLCSVAFWKFWHQWCKTPGILRVLRAPRRATLVATLDAMGQGDRFASGGFLQFSSCVIWFSKLHSAGRCFFWADAQ